MMKVFIGVNGGGVGGLFVWNIIYNSVMMILMIVRIVLIIGNVKLVVEVVLNKLI